jgi:hypothetical protein
VATQYIWDDLSGTIPGGGTSNETTIVFDNDLWFYFLERNRDSIHLLGTVSTRYCVTTGLVSYSGAGFEKSEALIEFFGTDDTWHRFTSFSGSWFTDPPTSTELDIGGHHPEWLGQTAIWRLRLDQVPGFFTPRSFTGLTLAFQDQCGFVAPGPGTGSGFVMFPVAIGAKAITETVRTQRRGRSWGMVIGD